MERQILTVSQLNEKIKAKLDGEREFQDVYVRGEISNYTAHQNGYSYFSLKDEGAVLNCVMPQKNLRFRPENGMKVVLRGRISTYVKGGVYQLYASGMNPEGVGELAIAFQQLKERLHREGLFDEKHKKPLPRYPRKIAVITAGKGKAVHDIISTLQGRYPMAKVLLMAVRVQGERAPLEIVGALRYANKWKVADLIITGRGGGSMEDLWAFNDERVARAIYESEIPVISAVGHEPDVTISDFVADRRGATPTKAAIQAVPDQMELLEWLRTVEYRLAQAEKNRLRLLRQRLNTLTSKRVMTDHLAYIQDRGIELGHLQKRLGDVTSGLISRKETRFTAAAAKLDALSPLKVLARGYAMAQDGDGKILRSWKDVPAGGEVRVTLGEGGFTATVNAAYGKEQEDGSEHDV